MTRVGLLLVLIVATGLPLASQTPRFEVASVKQVSVPTEVLSRMSFVGACGLPIVERSGSRVAVPFSGLCGLIRVAYDVADYQVVAIPADLGKGDASSMFAIEARVTSGITPTMEDTRLMLRTLLAERFKLRVHREPRDLAIYALVIAKGGPRFTPCSNPNASSGYSPGRIVSCNPPIPMGRIAQFLSREAGWAVLERTGLAPQAFELHWLPDSAPSLLDSPPSLFTALQEQLGLKLEPSRGPVEVLMIDSVERPTPD
jgi:uncharacterized protein (TIGR03435 family)